MSMLFTGVAPRDQVEQSTQVSEFVKGQALGAGLGIAIGAASAAGRHHLQVKKNPQFSGRLGASVLGAAGTGAALGAFVGDVAGTYRGNKKVVRRRKEQGKAPFDRDDAQGGRIPLRIIPFG